MDAGKETLASFAEEWWRLYAVPNLEPKTLQGLRRPVGPLRRCHGSAAIRYAT